MKTRRLTAPLVAALNAVGRRKRLPHHPEIPWLRQDTQLRTAGQRI